MFRTLKNCQYWQFCRVKVPLTLCKSAAYAVKTIGFCVFEAKFWCKRAEYGASESPECEFRSEWCGQNVVCKLRG